MNYREGIRFCSNPFLHFLTVFADTYKCDSHLDCLHKEKLSRTTEGDWVAQESGAHNTEANKVESAQLLTPSVKQKLDALIAVNTQPLAMERRLLVELPNNAVPSLKSIQNYKAREVKLSTPELRTDAQLLELRT
jgi:hypothetical protein